MPDHKLLIVEDEPTVRELIRRITEEAGYWTVTAENGREALAVLSRRPCDLIVSDIRMPEVDGLALLAALKKKTEETDTAPVGALMLTASHEIETAVRAMQLGALDYVLKPIDPSSLVSSINCVAQQARELTEAWREAQDREQLLALQGMELASVYGQLEAISGSSRTLAVSRPVASAGISRQEATQHKKERSDIAPSADYPPAADTTLFEIPVKLAFEDAGSEKLDAKICRVNKGFLVLSSALAFERGQSLKVLYRERAINSKVVYCNPRHDGTFRIGLATQDGKYGSFRVAQRIPVHLAITVRVAGRPAPVAATVIDISSSGISLTSAEPFSAGEMVCVDLGTSLVFGEVRHCKEIHPYYRVGVVIDQCLCEDGPGKLDTA